MKDSKIEWTDHTFNAWWGCVKVSPACDICYADTFAKRVGEKVWGPDARRRFFGEKHWAEPFKWDRAAERDGVQRRVFCASMADVFEFLPESHPDAAQMERERGDLWCLIEATPHLDWLLLTKRPQNMTRMAPERWRNGWPVNVVAMTTAENQHYADVRIPELLKVPAQRRGVSIEPLIEAVNLRPFLFRAPYPDVQRCPRCGYFTNRKVEQTCPNDASLLGADVALDWVIVGGESGHGARPMHPDWARDLKDQCWNAGVPFLFKQWGEWAPQYGGGGCDDPCGRCVQALPDGSITTTEWVAGSHLRGSQAMHQVGKKAAGRILDGRTWDEFPPAVLRLATAADWNAFRDGRMG